MLKKLLSMALAAIMVMGIGTTALAEESQLPSINSIGHGRGVESQSTEYLVEYEDGTKVVAAYRATENGVKELSKAEYLSYLKQIELQETRKSNAQSHHHSFLGDVTERVAGVPFTWYDERGTINDSHRTNLRSRVSNYVYNRGTQVTDLEVSGSKTHGATANFSLSSGDKSAVKMETGFSYSTSYTFSQKILQRIPANRKGWMEFYPIMHNSYGNLQYGITTDINPFYVITSEKWVDVYFPQKLSNGQLDGVYELMEGAL